MSEFYSRRARELQDRFDTRRLADRLTRLTRDRIDDEARELLARADMFFLASVDESGQPTCSYKGGEPGFVRVLDERTLAFPSFDGNGMFLSLANLCTTSKVGLLFVDFEGQTRMRIHGDAFIDLADPLAAEIPEAQIVVRVRVREVFPNCPRYVHRMQLIERSRFVPRAGCTTPVPAWKRFEWAVDALPENDPARDPASEIRRR